MWHKRLHCSADPGRPTNVHLRVDGWPNQQFALLFVDWLAANPDAQEQYSGRQARRRACRRVDDHIADYVAAKEPWFSDAYRQAWDWADAIGLAAYGLGSGAPQASTPFIGSALPASRTDHLVDLNGDIVVHVDLAVHVGRIRPPDVLPACPLMRIGQHRVGLKCVAGHGAQLAMLVWLSLVTKVAWLPGATPSTRAT